MRNSTELGGHRVLTKTGDYALRALLVLAQRGVGRPLPADALAYAIGAPTNYMGKTLHLLARAGLVRGIRGPSGGFALAVEPDTISLARIADVFGEAPASRRCLLGTGPCNAAAPCAAHGRWMRVVNATREPLATTTLADLLADAGLDGASDSATSPFSTTPRAAAGAY
ncbi:MAG TPA: Rrf2 family transcriptional regulator [Gemmatimonadaceae bacterium]